MKETKESRLKERRRAIFLFDIHCLISSSSHLQLPSQPAPAVSVFLYPSREPQNHPKNHSLQTALGMQRAMSPVDWILQIAVGQAPETLRDVVVCSRGKTESEGKRISFGRGRCLVQYRFVKIHCT